MLVGRVGSVISVTVSVDGVSVFVIFCSIVTSIFSFVSLAIVSVSVFLANSNACSNVVFIGSFDAFSVVSGTT